MRPLCRLQDSDGMRLPELRIRHFFKNSEHGSIIHIVTEHYQIPAVRHAVILEEQAAGHPPLHVVVSPEILFRVFGTALQYRIIHNCAGNGEPSFHIRVLCL